jgi:lipoprotein-anchoring transpeptidase ErfK/SrfK
MVDTPRPHFKRISNAFLNRRIFLLSAASFVAGCATANGQTGTPGMPGQWPVDPQIAAMYAGIHDEPFEIPPVDTSKIDPQLLRQTVAYTGSERPGTVVVDPHARFLYLIMEAGQALRYGVGVGRDGFEWSGEGIIQYKRAWPRWTPPDEMVTRQPELEPYSIANGGMSPGLANPLGARALYIFRDGRDTLYRLHGTNEPWSIGKAVSSGCIRLLNQDVIDLYNRVPDRTPIVVRAAPGTDPSPDVEH